MIYSNFLNSCLDSGTWQRNSGVTVGQAEGYLTSGRELIAVIYVNEAYHKQGIGKAALCELIRNWGEDTITGIIGSWHADEEFGC